MGAREEEDVTSHEEPAQRLLTIVRTFYTITDAGRQYRGRSVTIDSGSIEGRSGQSSHFSVPFPLVSFAQGRPTGRPVERPLSGAVTSARNLRYGSEGALECPFRRWHEREGRPQSTI